MLFTRLSNNEWSDKWYENNRIFGGNCYVIDGINIRKGPCERESLFSFVQNISKEGKKESLFRDQPMVMDDCTNLDLANISKKNTSKTKVSEILSKSVNDCLDKKVAESFHCRNSNRKEKQTTLSKWMERK